MHLGQRWYKSNLRLDFLTITHITNIDVRQDKNHSPLLFSIVLNYLDIFFVTKQL